MLGNLTGWHFLILLVIVLLIFGATRLPSLAKSLGQSTKILRDELKDGSKDDAAAKVEPATTQSAEKPAESSATSSGPESRP